MMKAIVHPTIACCLCFAVFAQAGPELLAQELQPNMRLRVTAPGVAPQRIVGTLTTVEPSSLTLQTPKGRIVVPRDAIEALELSERPNSKRKGAIAGVVVGVVAALITGYGFHELPSLKASADHSASARLPQIPVQRVKPACAARNASSNRVTTSGQHRPGTTEVALQPIPTASLRTILPWVDDLYVHGGIAFGEGAVEGDEREIARLGERGQVVVGPELVIVVVSG